MIDEIKNDTNVEENEPEITISDSFNPKDYKIIVDLIKEMDESYEMIKKTLYNTLHDRYHLNEKVIEDSLKYNKYCIDDPEMYSTDEIRNFLIKHQIDTGDYALVPDEELRNTLKIVKDSFLILERAKASSDDIKKDSAEILKEYFNYISSSKVDQMREKKLEDLKKANDLETDETYKKKNQEMIDAMEATITYSFMYERLESIGEKEITSILEGYFKEYRGSSIIGKYKNKIKKCGFNETIYTHFFNLEEDFLPEEYAPFNNLFLFIYMRYVSYIDAYDKKDTMKARAITGAIANLIYHKFQNKEKEDEFIELIKKVDNFFIDYKDRFINENTTYKNHPLRIETEHKTEEKKREIILKKLADYDIPVYEGIEDEPIDKLLEYYNRKVQDIKERQLKEYDEKEPDKGVTSYNTFEGITSKIHDEINNVMKEGINHERLEDEQDETVENDECKD